MTEAVTNKSRCMECFQQFGSEAKVCPNDGGILVPIKDQGEDPHIGTTLGESYDILSIAGKGGMGVVYRGQHRALDRIVAIKMLRADLVAEETSYKRFQVEAVAASRLTHPNVVGLYDYGVATTGQPFLIMEFVEGTTLSALLADEGAMTVTRALPIFMQICSALEHAHNKGVIHRDVKPSNTILIKMEGQPDLVKVVDFGIAQIGELKQDGLKITKTGEIFGSPVYMSPEQCTGQGVDARSDVYSVGVLMYETLMGVTPFGGATAIDAIQKKFSEEPMPFVIARPHANIQPAVEAVVMKALERDPNRRFQSMAQLKNALEAASCGYSLAIGSMTGSTAAVAIPSEFAGMDLRKEVELLTISTQKLRSRARAARLLSAERNAAPLHLEKLKSNEAEPRPHSGYIGLTVWLLAALFVAAGACSWLNHESASAIKDKGMSTRNKVQSRSHLVLKVAAERRGR